MTGLDGVPATVRIGLTGPIGCGKSTVAGWLGELGAVVIDADAVAREVTPPGQRGRSTSVLARVRRRRPARPTARSTAPRWRGSCSRTRRRSRRSRRSSTRPCGRGSCR